MSTETEKPRLASRQILHLLTPVLLLLALAYIGKGFYELLIHNDPGDLRMKWIDERYILHGRDPMDVWFRLVDQQNGITQPRTTRNTDIDPSVGPPMQSGYAPWSYFTGLAIYWPTWKGTRIWFALLNMAAFGVTAWWIREKFAYAGAVQARFLVAAALAISFSCTALGIGQYAVVTVGLLALVLWADERNSWLLAGFFLGLAMFKPTIGIPFLLPFFAKQRWRTLAVAVIYMIVGSCFTWAMTKANPLTMLMQMQEGGQPYTAEQVGVAGILAHLGASNNVKLALTACYGGAVLITMVMTRHRSMLFQFGLAGLSARFWTYHGEYDNLILIFLLLACAEAAIQDGGPLVTAAFWLLALSLWAPDRVYDHRPAQLALVAIHIIVLLVLCATQSRGRGTPDDSPLIGMGGRAVGHAV
jgi:hypothetical protein